MFHNSSYDSYGCIEIVDLPVRPPGRREIDQSTHWAKVSLLGYTPILTSLAPYFSGTVASNFNLIDPCAIAPLTQWSRLFGDRKNCRGLISTGKGYSSYSGKTVTVYIYMLYININIFIYIFIYSYIFFKHTLRPHSFTVYKVLVFAGSTLLRPRGGEGRYKSTAWGSPPRWDKLLIGIKETHCVWVC